MKTNPAKTRGSCDSPDALTRKLVKTDSEIKAIWNRIMQKKGIDNAPFHKAAIRLWHSRDKEIMESYDNGYRQAIIEKEEEIDSGELITDEQHKEELTDARQQKPSEFELRYCAKCNQMTNHKRVQKRGNRRRKTEKREMK
jgi:hypothetical protein